MEPGWEPEAGGNRTESYSPGDAGEGAGVEGHMSTAEGYLPGPVWERAVELHHDKFLMLFLVLACVWFCVLCAWRLVAGRRLLSTRSAPVQLSKLQQTMMALPQAKVMAFPILVYFFVTCIDATHCLQASHMLMTALFVVSEALTMLFFMLVSTGWCIISDEILPLHRRRITFVTAVLFGSMCGNYFGLPLFFTFLVIIFCTAVALVCHNAYINIRLLHMAWTAQQEILMHEQNLGRDTPALHRQVLNLQEQMDIMNHFRRFMGFFVIFTLFIQGPVYFTFSGDKIWIQIMAQELLHLLCFCFLCAITRNCHADRFVGPEPSSPFVQLPDLELGGFQLPRVRQNVEVWEWESADPSADRDAIARRLWVLGLKQVEPGQGVPHGEGSLVIVEQPGLRGPDPGAGAAGTRGLDLVLGGGGASGGGVTSLSLVIQH